MNTNRPYMGSAVVAGFIRFLSVSQIVLFDPEHEGCWRKWWFQYVAKKKLARTGALDDGDTIAQKLEHYLKTNEDVLPPILQEAKRFFPIPGPDLEVEKPLGRDFAAAVKLREAMFKPENAPGRETLRQQMQYVAGLTALGIPLDGKADYRHQRGEFIDEDGILTREHPQTSIVEIGDLKTTVRIRPHKITRGENVGKILPGYAKTSAQVCAHPQMVGYARHAVDHYPGITHVRLSHVYASKGVKDAAKRTGIISVEEVLRRWHGVETVVGQMVQVATAQKVEDVQAAPQNCDAYTHIAPDGTTQKGCGHRYYCPLATAVVAQNLLGSHKESAMSLFDTLSPSALPSIESGRSSYSDESPSTPPVKTDAERAAIEAEKQRLLTEDAVRVKGGPLCQICGNASVRYMNAMSGSFFLCAKCEPPEGRQLPLPPMQAAPPPPPPAPHASSWLKNPMAVSPPDAPPPADIMQAADPLPPAAMAEITDPALKQTVEQHAAVHQTIATQKAEAEAASKPSVWCPQSSVRLALTVEMALAKKYLCQCGKDIRLKPAKNAEGQFEATLPRHKPVNVTPGVTVAAGADDEEEETVVLPPPPPPAPPVMQAAPPPPAPPVQAAPPPPPAAQMTMDLVAPPKTNGKNGNGHHLPTNTYVEEPTTLLRSIDVSLKELVLLIKGKAA